MSRSNCTNASTESLEPIESYPSNDAWIISRCLFLMEMKTNCPEYFYGAWGQTVGETMDNYLKSLSHELMVLSAKYPKHYLYASQKELDNWMKEGVDGNASIPK